MRSLNKLQFLVYYDSLLLTCLMLYRVFCHVWCPGFYFMFSSQGYRYDIGWYATE